MIGIDRPERRNAIDADMVDALHDVLAAVRNDPCLLVIHSTTPGMFVSGADIAELRDRTAEQALRAINAELFHRIATHRWPTIAVVDGPALGGGCELALACDFRIASPAARFAQPEPQLGIIAGAGGNWRLGEVVGLQAARRMLLAGEAMSAEQARAAGLVDEVVDQDALLDAAEGLAAMILRSSWQALELTKLALRNHRAEVATRFDLVAQAVLFESEEKRTRMDKFLSRRSGRGGGQDD